MDNYQIVSESIMVSEGVFKSSIKTYLSSDKTTLANWWKRMWGKEEIMVGCTVDIKGSNIILNGSGIFADNGKFNSEKVTIKLPISSISSTSILINRPKKYAVILILEKPIKYANINIKSLMLINNGGWTVKTSDAQRNADQLRLVISKIEK